MRYLTASQSGDSENETILDLSSSALLDPYVHHTFEAGNPTWTPWRLEVNGRKGRRAVCVISQDRLRYILYDLDSSHEEDEEEEIKNTLEEPEDGDGDTPMEV